MMAALAQRLRALGVDIREVSVGSTPTALPCAAVPGITFKAPAFLFPFMGFILVGFLAAGVKKLVFFLNSKPREKRRRRKSFSEPAFEAPTDTTGGAADE